MTSSREKRNPFPRIHEVHRPSRGNHPGLYRISAEVAMAWLLVLAGKVHKHGTG